MVMGNASGKKDGEGTSGVKKYGFEQQEGEERDMEFSQAAHMDSMVHSPLHSPIAYQPSLFINPQFPVASLPRPNEGMQVQNQALQQNRISYEDAPRGRRTVAMITWSHGGKQVAVIGTWDNWETVEPLHSLGRDFIIMKALPSGVYHYRFIVDEQLRYAPDLPWECDDSGIAYNILDLQGESSRAVHAGDERAPESIPCLTTDTSFRMEQAPEAPESLVDFESPPSPLSSYDNEPLIDGDFTKAPPDLPPLLQMTPLNEPPATMFSLQPLPRPRHSILNHLYIQNCNGGQTVALGSTHRFRQKYVTVLLYKPSRR